MKQRIIPVVSVTIGIVAFVLTSQYLRREMDAIAREWERIEAGAKQVFVVAAARDIPLGTRITQADLGKLSVLRAHIPDRVVMPDDANLLLGKKTLYAVKQNRPVFWSDIEGGARPGEGLAGIVKPGMRAVSLSVSGAAAVSGMVRPNDRIDVLGTFSFPSDTVAGEMETVTLTALQDVTVLATGNTLAKEMRGRQRTRSGSYSTVTLEATPREAEVLVFAQQMKGRLTLTLRNPNDVHFEQDLPEVNFRLLEESLPELNLIRQRDIRHKRNL